MESSNPTETTPVDGAPISQESVGVGAMPQNPKKGKLGWVVALGITAVAAAAVGYYVAKKPASDYGVQPQQTVSPQQTAQLQPAVSQEPQYTPTEREQQNRRDTMRITDVSQIRTAVENYFEDNGGKYPTVISQATIGVYLHGELRTDPLTGAPYRYVFGPNSTSPQQYDVSAELENYSNALKGDSDLKFTLPDGTSFDGGLETCTPAPNDCIYDMGVK